MEPEIIYLDHAATTPVSKRALEAMQPYFVEKFYNPSAPYLPAHAVRTDYEAAKAQLAHVIGTQGEDLVITSGATEANALARAVVSPDGEALVLVTEHASLKNFAHGAAAQEIAVDAKGVVDLDDLASKITPRTELVSLSLANNELGTIQPVARVAEIVGAERLRRLQAGETRPIYLHSDASQALSLLAVNVARLGVDLLTLNSAKVYGPKGVGALYHSHRVQLRPLITGGGQEGGLRGGTENVPGLIGFATAATEAAAHLSAHRKTMLDLRARLRAELEKAVVAPLFLGDPKHQLANFLPVSFPGIDAERLIFLLEAEGVLVATGAACAASKGQRSHVLQAIGLGEAEINGSLRISLGRLNSVENVTRAGQLICRAVESEARRTGLGQTESENA